MKVIFCDNLVTVRPKGWGFHVPCYIIFSTDRSNTLMITLLKVPNCQHISTRPLMTIPTLSLTCGVCLDSASLYGRACTCVNSTMSVVTHPELHIETGCLLSWMDVQMNPVWMNSETKYMFLCNSLLNCCMKVVWVLHNTKWTLCPFTTCAAVYMLFVSSVVGKITSRVFPCLYDWRAPMLEALVIVQTSNHNAVHNIIHWPCCLVVTIPLLIMPYACSRPCAYVFLWWIPHGITQERGRGS